MNINLFDYHREELLPLTFIRPVGDLRCGILTFQERWSKIFNTYSIGFQTVNYLQDKYFYIKSTDVYFINSCIIANNDLIISILSLELNQILYFNNIILAYRINNISTFSLSNCKSFCFKNEIKIIKYPWDLFRYNAIALEFDFQLLTKNRISQLISKTNGLIGDTKKIFLEIDAKIEYCTLNTTEGSIYIGKNSQIMEGSNIRGSFALCQNSIVSMGSKIYGSTTIGPYCKVGGELNNVVIWGYSNKKHDGFLGNSVIGQWCNFGANTNCSNLKNNYKQVSCWSYKEKKFIATNLQFCGVIFGDFSKTAISTQINTGTVIGIFSSLLHYKFLPNYISSFLYGIGDKTSKKFKLSQIFKICMDMMNRRNIRLNEIEKLIIKKIYILDL